MADTAEPPAISSSRAVRAKGTSAPQVTRNPLAAGLTRSPRGSPSSSSSGQSVLPAASSSRDLRNVTSPIVVASVRGRLEWTLDPAGLDDASSSRSLRSSARDSASAPLASAIRLAASSSAANPAGEDSISSASAASRAATAPGTMLRFTCGPPSPPNPKQLEG